MNVMTETTDIKAYFLGSGEVFMNGISLEFPYQKAKLLFLALLEKRSIERKKIHSLFWEDCPDRAPANARNALSVIKRLLPKNAIIADRKTSFIELNQGILKISSDLEELSAEKLNLENINRLSGIFLDDRSLDSNSWVLECRAFYREKLLDAISKKSEEAAPSEKNFWHSQAALLKYKKEDYSAASAGEKNKLVALHGLPFVRVEERDSILNFLDSISEDEHIENISDLPKCIIVFGEEGSGKSALANEVYEEKEREGSLCLHSRVFEGEGNDHINILGGIFKKVISFYKGTELNLPAVYLSYLMACFPSVFKGRPKTEFITKNSLKQNHYPESPKLVTLNPFLLGKIFAMLLESISCNFDEILLALEDVHWSDQLLPGFLSGLFDGKNVHINVLITCYPEFKTKLNLALAPIAKYMKHKEVLLKRLTLKQTELICSSVIPPKHLTEEKLAEIYNYTDGSPFLLREFLSFYDAEDWTERLSKSLYGVVHSRILSLTSDEARLLDCVAVFPGEASFYPLKALAGLDDNAMLNLYEQLHKKGLLDERQSGDSFAVLFRYSLVKKQIRENMSKVRWWNLNKRLLKYFKDNNGADIDQKALPIIAHHAGEPLAELDARIRILKAHFEMSHELFPKLSDGEISESAQSINDTLLTQASMSEAQELLNKLVRKHGRTHELARYERLCLTLQGGYLRWNGNYTDASNCLDEALKVAFQAQDKETATVDVLEQFCCLGIQKDDPALLKRYVFLFYRGALKSHLHPQLGMALRFLAILNIMEGRFEDALMLLKMSLRVFEKLETQGDGYTIGIIAANHSYGDVALYTGRHEDALSYYLQCVRLCESKGFYRGLGLHLAKAAWCAARLESIKEAREYLSLAHPLFEGFHSRRGASLCGGEIVFGLCALFDLYSGNIQKSYENLLKADELSKIMRKPLWQAMLFSIRALIKDFSEKHQVTFFDNILTNDTGYYLSVAERLFGRLGLSAENMAYEQLRRALILTFPVNHG